MDIRLRCRKFAETECRAYSDLYYRLALSVSRRPRAAGGDAVGRALRFLVARTRFANGQRRSELLALAHPHGAELAWL